jgi:pilus assembly protein CpaF
MLQAMNTGHDGSLTTVHANSPRDSITRLETLVMMSGLDMPISIVRRQIASAVDLIVQQARLRDGSRKVTSITELTGMEGENVVMQDIFKFDDEGSGEGGKVIGEFRPSGLRPTCTERVKTYGYKLPASMFMGSVRDNGRRRR